MKEDLILGIDFGTTKSSVGIWMDGNPFIIPHLNGEKSMPSELFISKEGGKEEVFVGWDAVRKHNYSENCYRVKHSKRMAGYADMKKTEWWYKYPQFSYAFILAELRLLAENKFNREIRSVVITVPIHFDINQRRAILEASKMAGLELKRLLNEPTACALSCLNGYHDQKVLVVDVGGGTTDVAILEIDDHVFEVLHTEGNSKLGGVDYSNRLYEWLLDELEKEFGIVPEDITKVGESILKDEVEQAKKQLTENESCTFDFSYIPFNGKIVDQPIVLTKTDASIVFEDLNYDIKEMVKEAIQKGKVKKEDVNEFLLMGSASRVLGLKEKLEQVVGMKSRRYNLQTSVAKGAIHYGGILTGQVENCLLLDCTQDSYGIKLANNKYEIFVEKNSALPTTNTKEFTTTSDGQTEFEVQVYRGRNPIADRNKYIGKLQVTGIPAMQAEDAKIKIKFEINYNMDILVSARVNNAYEVSTTLKSEFALEERLLKEFKRKIGLWYSKRKLNSSI